MTLRRSCDLVKHKGSPSTIDFRETVFWRSGMKTFFVILLASCLALTPARAQRTAAIPRIGFVAPQGRSLPLFDAFRQGLAERGYVEGRDALVESRFAEGNYERFPELFADLLQLKVDVVAVTGAVTARAARKVITGVPIVFAVVVDPVGDNIVPRMDAPGEASRV